MSETEASWMNRMLLLPKGGVRTQKIDMPSPKRQTAPAADASLDYWTGVLRTGTARQKGGWAGVQKILE